MTAPINLASRFSGLADPAEILRLLMGTLGNGAASAGVAAPADDFGDDDDGGDPTPRETASVSDGNGAPRPKAGRETNGRFAKGNEGGPGNPFNRQVAALRKQLLDAMTPAVFQMTIEALVCQACTGDVAALKLLYQYTLGKPAEAKDPDRVALEEVQLLRESNAGGRDWRDLTGAPFLETFLQSVRALQVISTERFQERFAGMLAGLQADEEKAARQQEAQRARREARRTRAAAVNPEVDAASRAASNPAGPAEQPKATAPSANRPDGAVVAPQVAGGEPGTGEPRATATGVPAATEARAPSANGPDGVPRKRRGPETRAERGKRQRPNNAASDNPREKKDAKVPIDHAAVVPGTGGVRRPAPSAGRPAPSAANHGKHKAAPLTNGGDGPAAGRKNVRGVPRRTRSSKRKTRAV